MATNTIIIMSINIPIFPFGIKEKEIGKNDVRLNKFIKIIENMEKKPDIICFQEIWKNDSKKFLQKKLKKFYPHNYLELSKKNILNSGLMILSKLKIKKKIFKIFKNFTGQEIVADKGVIGCEFSLKNGKTIYIFNTHLQSGRKSFDPLKFIFKKLKLPTSFFKKGKDISDVKLNQLKEIKKIVDKFTNDMKNGTVLLTGDFNIVVGRDPDLLLDARSIFPNSSDKWDKSMGETSSVWSAIKKNEKLKKFDYQWILNNGKVIGSYKVSNIVSSDVSDHLATIGIYDINSFI